MTNPAVTQSAVGVEVDLAHYHVLLCALVFVCIVVTKNNQFLDLQTCRWNLQYM